MPALTARGAADFRADLARLAQLAEDNASVRDVEAAAAQVMAKLDAAANVLPADQRGSLKTRIGVALALLDTAADEYDTAVVDGKILNIGEYQDSLGFMRVAKTIIDSAAAELKARAPDVHASIVKAFADMRPAWPSAVPPAKPVIEPGALRAIVSRLELSASQLPGSAATP